MKNVYAVRNDKFNYQELALDIKDIADKAPDNIRYLDLLQFSMNNVSMKPWWKPIKASFSPIEGLEESLIPDIGTWIGASLFLSPKAYQANFRLQVLHCRIHDKQSLGEESALVIV